MLKKDDPYSRIHEHNKKICELEIRNEALDQEIKVLLDTFKVTPQQLTHFLQNKDNFSENNWITIQKVKKDLEEELNRDLTNIQNPHAREKVYKERQIPNFSLFVK